MEACFFVLSLSLSLHWQRVICTHNYIDCIGGNLVPVFYGLFHAFATFIHHQSSCSTRACTNNIQESYPKQDKQINKWSSSGIRRSPDLPQPVSVAQCDPQIFTRTAKTHKQKQPVQHRKYGNKKHMVSQNQPQLPSFLP